MKHLDNLAAIMPALCRFLGMLLTILVCLWAILATSATLSENRHSPDEEDTIQGEMLIHRVQPLNAPAHYCLPLTGTLPAIPIHHPGPLSRQAWFVLFAFIQLGLLAGLGIMAGSPAAGIAAAAILLATGKFLPQINDFNQSISATLTLLVAAGLLWRERRFTPIRNLAMAAAIGFCLFQRSPLVLFPPLLLLWDFFRKKLNKKNFWVSLIIIAVPFLILTPWIWMNWVLHQEFVPLEKGQGSSNIITGALGVVTGPPADWSALTEDAISTKTGGALRWAVLYVLKNPLPYFSSVLERLLFSFKLHPFLFLFAGIGFWFRRARPDIRLIALLAAYFLGIHCLISLTDYYLMPLWPLLAFLAAAIFINPRMPQHSDPFSRLAVFFWALIMVGTFSISSYTAYALIDYGRLAKKRPPVSDEALSQALLRAPLDSWLVAERGMRRLGSGRAKEAFQDLLFALKQQPDNPRHQLEMAAALAVYKKNPNLAGGIKLEKDATVSMVETGLEIRQKLTASMAAMTLSAPRQARKNVLEAWDIFRSRIFLSRMETPDDEKILDLLRENAGTSFSSIYNEMLGHWPARRRAELLHELARSIKTDCGLWTATASLYLEAGDPGKAENTIRQAAGIVCKNAGQKRRWAELLLRLGKAELLTGISVGLDSAKWIDGANKAIEKGDRKSAVHFLNRAEESNPTEENRHSIAMAYQSLGQYKKTSQILENLIAKKPKTIYLKDRGILKYLSGDAEGALQDLELAFKREPSLYSAALSLGALYDQRNRRMDAEAVYENALRFSKPLIPEEEPLQNVLRQALLRAREQNSK